VIYSHCEAETSSISIFIIINTCFFLMHVYLCVRELYHVFKPLLGFVANGFVKNNFIALLETKLGFVRIYIITEDDTGEHVLGK